MALDAKLEKQLLDARENIIAQLNETRFPSVGSDLALGHGGPAYDYAYVELQEELREIDELLGFKEGDQDDDALSEVPESPLPAFLIRGHPESPLPAFLTWGRQPRLSKFLAALSLLIVLLALVFLIMRT